MDDSRRPHKGGDQGPGRHVWVDHPTLSYTHIRIFDPVEDQRQGGPLRVRIRSREVGRRKWRGFGSVREGYGTGPLNCEDECV